MFVKRSLGLALLLGVPFAAWARSTGAPSGVTGAPGEGNCTACHRGADVNSGSGRLQIIVPGGATTYVPGQSIRLTVRLEDSAARRWGFELTSRSAATPANPSGTIAVVPGDTNAQVVGATGSVQHATHTSPGTRPDTTGSATWELDWTPPADNSAVTFYAAGNAANNSGNNQGDLIYTTSLTLQPAAGTGVQPAASRCCRSWPLEAAGTHPCTSTTRAMLP